MNNGAHVTLEDLAREARRRRRVRMGKKAAWWVVMLGIAFFLGWLLSRSIRALPVV